MEKKPERRLDVEAPPAGLPETAMVSCAPLREEIEEIQRHAKRTLEINASDAAGLALAWVVERMRRRMWEAANRIEEASPREIGRMLGFSPDTVIYWCKTGKVRYRRKGRVYIVDVASAVDYAARRERAVA